jgi:hypothetical protein
MIFQYKIARITPSAAVYGRAGCITVHYLQFGPAQGIPFTSTNTSSIDVHGVSISSASTMGVQDISLSTASSMDVQVGWSRKWFFYLRVIRKWP